MKISNIGDEWLHVDVTNNETNTGIPYMLYNSNDETAESINAFVDDEFWIDSELDRFIGTDNSKDYYEVNDLVVNDVDEYTEILVEEIKEGKEITVLRYLGKFDQNEFVQSVGEALQEHAPEKIDTATLGMLGNYIIVKY